MVVNGAQQIGLGLGPKRVQVVESPTDGGRWMLAGGCGDCDCDCVTVRVTVPACPEGEREGGSSIPDWTRGKPFKILFLPSLLLLIVIGIDLD